MNSVDMRCVRAGIKFLDKVRPEWRSLIDRDKLDMVNPYRCIAGQVFADEAIKHGSPDGYTYFILNTIDRIEHDCDYGFYLHPEGSDFIELRSAWIELAQL